MYGNPIAPSFYSILLGAKYTFPPGATQKTGKDKPGATYFQIETDWLQNSVKIRECKKLRVQLWKDEWKDEWKDQMLSEKMKGWVQRWKDECKYERLSAKMKGWV